MRAIHSSKVGSQGRGRKRADFCGRNRVSSDFSGRNRGRDQDGSDLLGSNFAFLYFVFHSLFLSIPHSLARSLAPGPSFPPSHLSPRSRTHTHTWSRGLRGSVFLAQPGAGTFQTVAGRRKGCGREGKLSRRGVYSRPSSHSSFILHSSFVPGVPPSAWQKILLFCRPGGRGLETRGAEHASVEGKEQGRQGAGE